MIIDVFLNFLSKAFRHSSISLLISSTFPLPTSLVPQCKSILIGSFLTLIFSHICLAFLNVGQNILLHFIVFIDYFCFYVFRIGVSQYY